MSTTNQQTLVESGAKSRPLILEKGSYVPWASRFLRFLDNKREEGELMRRSIDKCPYRRKEIVDPNDNSQKILEPIKELSTDDQKQYYADIKFEPHAKAYKAKKTARNHDPLALAANSHVNPSYSYESPSYSRSPQPYYVTHPSSVIDYDDYYHREIQGDTQEDKLSTGNTTICHVYYVRGLGHNLYSVGHFCDGDLEVAFRSNTCYVHNLEGEDLLTGSQNDLVQKIEEYDQNVQRVLRTESTLGKTNVQCYNCNGKGHYTRECPKTKVRDAKYFKEQMLLPAKYKAGVNLDAEENDVMLMNAYGVSSSNRVRMPESKDNNLKKRVLLNTKSKSTSKDIYAYGDVRAKNQDLLMTISELKDKLKTAEKGKNVNTKFDKYATLEKLLCVTPMNKNKDLKAKMVSKVDIKTDKSKRVTSCSTPKNKQASSSSVRRTESKETNLKKRVFLNTKSKSTSKDGEKSLVYLTVATKSSKLGATPIVSKSRTRKIMETIYVKFDEFTAMASKCSNSGPGLNYLNFQDSSEDSNTIPSKEDLDNLFGTLYKEYYETRTPKVSDNFAADTLNNEDTPSSSSIIVEEHEAPQLVSSSKEPIANEPTTLVSDDNVDESVQEDVAELDGNTFINPFHTPVVEEAKSSLTYRDPSNMHEFYQKHRSADTWTKNHLLEQVIGDPSKPVMTKSRLHTDAELCMYALTVSTTEPTNIKEIMLDHSWIESMQDKLNQFKRLDVWELVERPIDRNIIKVKWL
nr:hypothetical protein [Tanacetum cinerariifolium]